MNTAREAAAYALRIAVHSASERPFLEGNEYVECARLLNSSGRFERRTACKSAAETASPHAPPRQRKKFRSDITTARWALVQCAWHAICVGWKVLPIPMPAIPTVTQITAGVVVLLNLIMRPAPLTRSVRGRCRRGRVVSLQRPETKANPYQLAVPLHTGDILSRSNRDYRVACHHGAGQSRGDNWTPSASILVIQWEIIEEGLINSSPKECLHE
jgi:hypothetical protein